MNQNKNNNPLKSGYYIVFLDKEKAWDAPNLMAVDLWDGTRWAVYSSDAVLAWFPVSSLRLRDHAKTFPRDSGQFLVQVLHPKRPFQIDNWTGYDWDRCAELPVIRWAQLPTFRN